MIAKALPPVAAAVTILLAAGCGAPKEQKFEIPTGMVEVTDDGTSATVTANDGTTVQMTTTEDGAAVATSDGASLTVGELVEFPEDTPDALPRFPAMKLHAVTASESPRTITYQGEVSLPPASAMSWYQSETKKHGWEETNLMEQTEFIVANYEKDGATLNISILAGEPGTGTGTVLNVTYGEK